MLLKQEEIDFFLVDYFSSGMNTSWVLVSIYDRYNSMCWIVAVFEQ